MNKLEVILRDLIKDRKVSLGEAAAILGACETCYNDGKLGEEWVRTYGTFAAEAFHPLMQPS